MMYRNKETGVILEPRNELVESQLKASAIYEEYTPEKPEKPEKPVSQMNKDELLAKAAELEISVPDGATNDAIRELIKGKTQQ